MNFKRFSWLALPLLFVGFSLMATAQVNQTNHSFSWKESTDPWFQMKVYSFRYAENLTEKGQSVKKATTSRGPVCSNGCKETTAPDACTQSLIQEKCNLVKLSNASMPQGYSGVEYVTFDIQANGKVNSYQVVKQAVVCKPCVQAAVNTVANIGEWYPALQDGIPVKSTVVIPVFFKADAGQRQ